MSSLVRIISLLQGETESPETTFDILEPRSKINANLITWILLLDELISIPAIWLTMCYISPNNLGLSYWPTFNLSSRENRCCTRAVDAGTLAVSRIGTVLKTVLGFLSGWS